MSTTSITLSVLAPRALTRCRVCGFSEIRTDEVVDRGLLVLAECPRCEHRFTASALQRVAVVRGRSETGEEAASAA